MTENLGTESHEADDIPEEHRDRIYCSYDCRYQQRLIASLEDIELHNTQVKVSNPEDYEYAVKVAEEYWISLSEWYTHYLNDEPLFDDEATRELCSNVEDLVTYLGDQEYQYCLTCGMVTETAQYSITGKAIYSICSTCHAGHTDIPQGDLS